MLQDGYHLQVDAVAGERCNETGPRQVESTAGWLH